MPMENTLEDRNPSSKKRVDAGSDAGVDAEEQIKIFAIRLAFAEKLASRIGAVAAVWGTASVLSAFGSLLQFEDLWVVSALILMEAYRILSRVHEVEMLAIVRTLENRDNSTGAIAFETRPGTRLRTLHDVGSFSYVSNQKSSGSGTRKASSPSTLTKGGFSFLPIPLVANLFKPLALGRILHFVQLFWGLVGVALPVWRLSKHDFCQYGSDVKRRCSFSGYLFYGLSIVAAFLCLLEKVCFEYRKRFTDHMNSTGKHLHVDAVVLEIFSNKVYGVCLNGSLFDGFDMNLAEFGIQWLQSSDYDQRLHGARILNGVILAKSEGKYKHNSQTAQVVERLGTYPELLEMLVAILSWNSELEEELVEEIIKIIRGLVATDHNCSRFAVTPGALEALATHLVSRAHKPKMRGRRAPRHAMNREAKRRRSPEPYLQILCCLVATQYSSGRAFRQRVAGIREVMKILGDAIEDHEKLDLQQLSMRILYHLALEENARRAIGKTEGVIQSLFNLLQQDSNSVSRQGPETSLSCTLDIPQSENEMEVIRRPIRPGMVLSRLMLQNEANCKILLTLKDTLGNSFVRVMQTALHDGDDDIAASAAEILRSVWEYADESTMQHIADSSEEILLQTISEASTQSIKYEAALGLASRALPVEKYKLMVSEERFIDRLVGNLRDDPNTSKVPKARRYSIEFLIAIIKRTALFCDPAAKSDLEIVLKETLDSTRKVEDFILRSGVYGCGRHAKSMKSLCEDAVAALNER